MLYVCSQESDGRSHPTQNKTVSHVGDATLRLGTGVALDTHRQQHGKDKIHTDSNTAPPPCHRSSLVFLLILRLIFPASFAVSLSHLEVSAPVLVGDELGVRLHLQDVLGVDFGAVLVHQREA